MSETNRIKESLASAVTALSAEKPLARVAEADICGKSGISRKDFTAHFRDKYELLNWMFLGDVMRFAGNGGAEENAWRMTDGVIRYLDEQRDFYRWALAADKRNSFAAFFRNTLDMLIRKEALAALGQTKRADFFAEYHTGAALAAIMRWLDDPHGITADELIILLRRAFGGAASAAKGEGEDVHDR